MAGPTYTYTADTPQAANPMNQTTVLIRQNFEAINELVGVDHIGFNVTENGGTHQKLTLPMQTDVPATSATDIVMFSQLTPDGPNDAEIFGVWPTGDVFQISNVGSPSGDGGDGWSQFPSGIIFRWGIFTLPSFPVGNTVYTYDFVLPTGSGIPPFTSQIPYLQVSPVNCSPANFVNMLGIQANVTSLTTITVYEFTTWYVQPLTLSYFMIGM